MSAIDAGRRAVLKQLVAVPSAVTLGSVLWSEQALATPITNEPAIDTRLHFLRRTSFGVRPADWTRVQQLGIAAYLEEQFTLKPQDDPADAVATAAYPLAHLSGPAYWRVLYPVPTQAQLPGENNATPQIRNNVRRTNATLKSVEDYNEWEKVQNQMGNNVLYRALHSKRQLLEVMVQFWTNHLNSYDPTWRGEEQQVVIRKHALGNFRDMIFASQKDTSMSRYLNNDENKEPIPNENYARELMELHLLGEGNGYNQADVVALAHMLTGHTWDKNRSSPTFGSYKYEPTWHQANPPVASRSFMGATIASNGQYEIDAAINHMFNHPANYVGKFIAFKLCRYFVSDTPPDALVQRAANTFRNWGWDIKAVLREILLSPEFQQARTEKEQRKLARPMEYGVGVLRAFDIHISESIPASLRQFVLDTGNRPFWWPTPDGYPDRAGFWASTSAFIKRWNFAALEAQFNSANEKLLFNDNGTTRASRRVPKVAVPARDLVRQLAQLLLHRQLSPAHENLVVNYVTTNNPQHVMSVADVQWWASAIATILLSSPYAQFR